MDDIAEQHDIADELSDALSSAVGFSQDISDVSATVFCICLGTRSLVTKWKYGM